MCTRWQLEKYKMILYRLFSLLLKLLLIWQLENYKVMMIFYRLFSSLFGSSCIFLCLFSNLDHVEPTFVPYGVRGLKRPHAIENCMDGIS